MAKGICLSSGYFSQSAADSHRDHPRRSPDLVCLVEQALRACSTKHTKSGERRASIRREKAKTAWATRLPEKAVTCFAWQRNLPAEARSLQWLTAVHQISALKSGSIKRPS